MDPIPAQAEFLAAADLLLAADVGTSAIRAAVVDPEGHVHASAARPRAATSGAQFDPARLRHDFLTCLTEAVNTIDTARLRGLCVAGHVGTVLVDAAGAAIGEGYGWADVHGVDQLQSAWGDRLGEMLKRVGRPVLTGGSLAVLSWLWATDPGTAERVRWLLSPKDYLVFVLTGVAATDETSAAYTLALDVRARRWGPTLCQAVAVPAAVLPPISPATGVVGVVRSSTAADVGLPLDLPVIAGGPDGTVGSAALPGLEAGGLADLAGTTDVLVRVADSTAADPGAAVLNPYLTAGSWSYGGATGMTGGAVAEFARLLGISCVGEALARYDLELASIGPGAGDLRAMPALTGSRFPRWQTRDRGGLHGLTVGHGPAHLLRAALEGAAFTVREGVDLLVGPPGSGPEPSVVLAGGVSRSPFAVQLRADVLGRTIMVSDAPDATLLGAAVLAAAGTGVHASVAAATRSMSPPVRACTPDAERAQRYQALYTEWLALRDALGPIANGT